MAQPPYRLEGRMFSNPLDSVLFVLLLSVVAGLIAIIIHSWLWPKAKGVKPEYHLDALSMSIIERATKLLPADERETRREEWYAHLVDIGSPTERLLHSTGCYRAALTIRSEEFILAPIGNVVSSSRAFLNQKAEQLRSSIKLFRFEIELALKLDLKNFLYSLIALVRNDLKHSLWRAIYFVIIFFILPYSASMIVGGEFHRDVRNVIYSIIGDGSFN